MSIITDDKLHEHLVEASIRFTEFGYILKSIHIERIKSKDETIVQLMGPTGPFEIIIKGETK